MANTGPDIVVLTDEQIQKVEELAETCTLEQISAYMGITRRTFHTIKERQPEVELAWSRGKAKMINKVASSLISEAVSGNVPAAIFVLKTQAGWKEAKDPDVIESTHKFARIEIEAVTPNESTTD